jgi:hypothetical protein
MAATAGSAPPLPWTAAPMAGEPPPRVRHPVRRARAAEHPRAAAGDTRASRARGDASPPDSLVSTGGANHAASVSAGGGGATSELPAIVLVVLSAAAAPALRRHRIALAVPASRNALAPLERPG